VRKLYGGIDDRTISQSRDLANVHPKPVSSGSFSAGEDAGQNEQSIGRERDALTHKATFESSICIAFVVATVLNFPPPRLEVLQSIWPIEFGEELTPNDRTNATKSIGVISSQQIS
jgi:hypothetical protein